MQQPGRSGVLIVCIHTHTHTEGSFSHSRPVDYIMRSNGILFIQGPPGRPYTAIELLHLLLQVGNGENTQWQVSTVLHKQPTHTIHNQLDQ